MGICTLAQRGGETYGNYKETSSYDTHPQSMLVSVEQCGTSFHTSRFSLWSKAEQEDHTTTIVTLLTSVSALFHVDLGKSTSIIGAKKFEQMLIVDKPGGVTV